MSVTKNFEIERTYEVTMDYMVKHWASVSFHETREDAEAEIVRLRGEFSSLDCMYQVRDHTPTDYEAIDAMWSARYWSDRAGSFAAAEAHEREMHSLRGKQVEVVRGRKVPKGTTGEVFWVGESNYGYRTTWRVGFKTSEGEKHFTAASNVETLTEVAA